DWIVDATNTNQYSGVSGNVGIGNALPAAKLHVTGSLRFDNLPIGVNTEMLTINGLGDISRQAILDNNLGNEYNLAFAYDSITHIISITDGGGTLNATLSNLGLTNITAGAGLTGVSTPNSATLEVNADNGLYVNVLADKVRLGGNLVETTTIDLNNFDLLQNLTGTGTYQVQNQGNPTVFVNTDSTLKINTPIPAFEPNAIVQISSTKKGLLVPKMTTTQRDAIANPPLGLIVYNVSDSVAEHWNGNCWLAMFRQSCDECGFDMTLSDTLGIINKTLTDSVETTITVTQNFGPAATIGLYYLQNLPVGTSLSLSTYTINGTGTALLKVKADVFTPAGTYPIAIQGLCNGSMVIKTYYVQIEDCYKVFINGTVTDYDLQLINALPSNVPICVIATVGFNGKVYGNNAPAFTTGNLHSLSQVGIKNYGEIYGNGGNGATTPSLPAFGLPGQNGGHAVNLTVRANLQNNGYIFGGGGGGSSVGTGIGFTIPIVNIPVNIGIGAGGGGGAPDGLGGTVTVGYFSAGQNAVGGINGNGGQGGVLITPIPIPLGPVTITLIPNVYGGDGGDYGKAGTGGFLNANISVTVPIIGSLTFGPFPNPPLNAPFPGGAAGNLVKRNSNLLLGLPDNVYQSFQLRGTVGN
ncbi:MAG: hypothetical protein ACKVTZ_14985, partial [Bacteroidia bacterium]